MHRAAQAAWSCGAALRSPRQRCLCALCFARPLSPLPSVPLHARHHQKPFCRVFACNLEVIESWQPCSRQAVGTLVEELASLE